MLSSIASITKAYTLAASSTWLCLHCNVLTLLGVYSSDSLHIFLAKTYIMPVLQLGAEYRCGMYEHEQSVRAVAGLQGILLGEAGPVQMGFELEGYPGHIQH